MAASAKKQVVYQNEDILISVFNGPDRKAGRTLLDRRRWEVVLPYYDRSIELGAVDAAELAKALSASLSKETKR